MLEITFFILQADDDIRDARWCLEFRRVLFRSADKAIDPLCYGALVLAAMTWAVYTVRFRSSWLSALQSAALICFWSAVIFIPVYVGWNLSRLSQASSREIVFQLVYQGVLMSGVALFAYNRAVALLVAGAAGAMLGL